MSGALAIREEIHGLIDGMSERKLRALRPLLGVLTDDRDGDMISDEELTSFFEFEKELKEHPESFVSIAEYKQRRGLA
jgi:hypothetical protein